jgi:hypothetical protein
MKIFTKTLLFFLVIGALTFEQNLYAELLIVKKTEQGFTSLDKSDDKNKPTIESIAFHYQWPMIIGNTLPKSVSPETFASNKKNLLLADFSYIEAHTAQKSIRFVSKNANYCVIFFPNALYELFAIFEILSTQFDSNPLQQAIAKIYQRPDMGRPGFGEPSFAKVIDSGDTATNIRKIMNDTYVQINSICLESKDNQDSAYGYINKKLTSWLFSEYPTFKDCKSESDLSNLIQSKTEDLMLKLIKRLESLPEADLVLKYATTAQERPLPGIFVKDLPTKESKKLIAFYTALEYEAQDLNKGILVRGTNFIGFNKINDQEQGKKFAGSTVRGSVEQAYKEKTTGAYSISFGNYLFAGVLREQTSCAYIFLLGGAQTGYALLINKADYVETNNANLFLIPPLCALASLVTLGDWFHARAKAAVAIKDPKKAIFIYGLFDAPLIDPTGVLLITRDPLKHASLFSQFLADNGRIIQKGDQSQLTPEEKQFAENALTTQKEAAGYYKGIKGMKPMWETVLPKARKNLASQEGAGTAESVTEAKQ